MPSALDVTSDSEFIKDFVIGPPGTGKSVFASTFPTPGYVFDFALGIITYRGLNFDYDQFPMNGQGWVQFEKRLNLLDEEVRAEGKYITVVVDDITGMQALCMQRCLQLDPKRSNVGGPIWNVHYSMVRNLLEGKLRMIIDLPCNILLLAHMDVKIDNETGAVLSIEPLMTGQLPTVITGYFDEVYYTSTRKAEGKTVWVVQTIPIGLKNARSRLSGKQRLLPDFVENDYNILMKHVNRAKQTIKKEKEEKKNG
jgi:hypothetical protein